MTPLLQDSSLQRCSKAMAELSLLPLRLRQQRRSTNNSNLLCHRRHRRSSSNTHNHNSPRRCHHCMMCLRNSTTLGAEQSFSSNTHKGAAMLHLRCRRLALMATAVAAGVPAPSPSRGVNNKPAGVDGNNNISITIMHSSSRRFRLRFCRIALIRGRLLRSEVVAGCQTSAS